MPDDNNRISRSRSGLMKSGLSKLQGVPLVRAFVIDDEKTGPQIAVNSYISSPFDGFQLHSVIEEVLAETKGRILII
jgi:hypothetical protein